jgi:CheY-like chemotaxis protein
MKPCSRKATAGNERPSGWEIELMIVVADDDPLVQHSCKHLLEAAGYKVALATTGLEAIRALERSNVSAVLVDVFMPEMDGIETLLSIKKQSPTTSVIVMTGGRPGTDGFSRSRDAAWRRRSGAETFHGGAAGSRSEALQPRRNLAYLG